MSGRRGQSNTSAYHIERSIANRLKLHEYPCACNTCRGAVVRKVSTVAKHHIQNGRDPYLKYPILTVDGVHIQGPLEPPNRDGEQYRNQDAEEGTRGFRWPERPTVDVNGMVRDAFMHFDEIHNDSVNDQQDPHVDMNLEGDADMHSDVNVESLLRDSTEKIFEGSNLNRLQCCIVLSSLCSLYSVPNTFVDALLTWVAGDVLPTSNCFPRTSYEMKTMLMQWGLKHRQVHTCPEGHLLYEGENEELEECPTCQHPRYISGLNKVPHRVVRYFDIVSHLKRMFRCPEIAKLMTWHSNHKSEDGKMRSVVDSEQWKSIDRLYPDFAEVLTNLRLGLVGDGIIPFKNNAMKHSTWVLLITIYNLPPWLLSKKFFISLAVLIPGPTAPTAENIDIFLAPIVRDLLKLWSGVPAVNMAKPVNERSFTLRALLMWTINDFPAFGLLSGQQVHGYKGCPLCGPETCAEHARLLGKMIYLGARRYLPEDHRFRRARAAFNLNEEWDLPPERPSGEEVLRWGAERSQFLADGGIANSREDPVRLHGVKRRSIFFDLPYWQYLLVRHVLDVMHCEKNIAENFLKTVLGEKDTPVVRADLQARGIRPHLHLRPVGPNQERLSMPHASYVLSSEDKEKVFGVLKSLRTPSNYVSALHKKIVKGKFSGLKSHDFHVLLQQILPLCFRKVSNKALTRTIVRLSRVFRKLCAKTVDSNDKPQLTSDFGETMCLMEKEMPPSFFDIMSHLPNHLVEDLFLCGPVHTRWMYPYERYFKTLKGYVRNLAKPEGSIAQGYQMDEALGFVTEYMREYNLTTRRAWDSEEEPTMVDEILEGKGKRKLLSDDVRRAMHEFVLDNAAHIDEYRQRYQELVQERTNARSEFRRGHPSRGGRRGAPYPPGMEEIPNFPQWLEEEVEKEVEEGNLPSVDVQDSSKLPSAEAKTFKSMYAYGYHFRVRSAEQNTRTTCDSGVAAIFRQACRSSRQDQNFIIADLEYVGQVLEIVELNYGRHSVVLLVCDWVKANYRGRNATIKKDEWGFTLANFAALVPFGYESFAFPIHCHQVFFSDDEENSTWKVVLRTEVRGRRHDWDGAEEEEAEIFSMGRDCDFEGLQVGPEIEEEDEISHSSGRTVELNDLFHISEDEDPSLFDRDVGESSEDD